MSQAVRGMLDNPNEPVSDLSYFDCIESVMENSKVGLRIKQPGDRSAHPELSILSIPLSSLFVLLACSFVLSRSWESLWQVFLRTARPEM